MHKECQKNSYTQRYAINFDQNNNLRRRCGPRFFVFAASMPRPHGLSVRGLIGRLGYCCYATVHDKVFDVLLPRKRSVEARPIVNA